MFPLYGNARFCFIISVVCQAKEQPGKAHTVFADAAGLFCCNDTVALFKQAVHEPIPVYNGKAWQRLIEVCVRFRLNTTDTFDYKTYKLLAGTTNNHKQQQTHNYGYYDKQTCLGLQAILL